MDSASNQNIDILVLSIKECFVYRVPPLRSSSGHRAEDWDLANPIFTGCLKVFQSDSNLKISIYKIIDSEKSCDSEENISLFGQCPIEIKPGENITPFVDSVIDSSRYFVLRLKDTNSNKTAHIGIGFRERDQAFDFRNSLNEYVKFVDRMAKADKLSHIDFNEEYTHDSDIQKIAANQDHHFHFSPLKEGERIKVNLTPLSKSKQNLHSSEDENSSISATSSQLPSLLQPPPPPGSVIKSQILQDEESNSQFQEGEDVEWGEFQ